MGSDPINNIAMPDFEDSCFARVQIAGRPDFIGVCRNGESYLFLMRNEALCNPFYLESTGSGSSWKFTYDANLKGYIATSQASEVDPT